jgi:hypothetical protein
MANFDDFWRELKKEIGLFADANWKDLKKAALKDGTAFANKAKDDLERWTALLAEGRLTKKDFEFLVTAKKDLAVMETLKQAGLAQARLDRFVNGLIDVVLQTAFKVFL